MFERTKTFFQWLTGRSQKSNKAPEDLKTAYILKKNEKVTDEFCVCVFNGKDLLEVTEQISPETARQDKDLAFWAVARRELPLLLTVPVSAEIQLQSEIKIELVPSSGLGSLLIGKTLMTQSELQAVVQSHFSGLTGIIQGPISALAGLDEAGLKQLALKFNLLLSGYGLKCAQFGKFTEVKIAAPPVAPEEVEKELQTAVEPIKNEADWNEFSKNFQMATLLTPGDSQQMSELGKQLLENRISSAECARKIRQIAEEKARRVQEVQLPNEDHWNGLSIRMRLEAELTKISQTEAPKTASTPLEVSVERTTRPQTGIFWTNQKHLDEKLRNFLKTKLDFVQSVFENHRNSTQDVRIATELRLLLDGLNNVQTILKNAPSLDFHRGPLTTSKGASEMIDAMNQAVTAAEYLEAAVKSPEIFSSFPLPGELKTTLANLKNQLELRSKTR